MKRLGLFILFAAPFLASVAFSQNIDSDDFNNGVIVSAETCLTQAEHEELQRLRAMVELMADELQMRESLEQRLKADDACASNGFVDDYLLILPDGVAVSEYYATGDAASANRAIVAFLNDINYLGSGPLCSGECPNRGEVCAPTSIKSSSLDDFTLTSQNPVGRSRYILRDNDPSASHLRIKATCECIEGGQVEAFEG